MGAKSPRGVPTPDAYFIPTHTLHDAAGGVAAVGSRAGGVGEGGCRRKEPQRSEHAGILEVPTGVDLVTLRFLGNCLRDFTWTSLGIVYPVVAMILAAVDLPHIILILVF